MCSRNLQIEPAAAPDKGRRSGLRAAGERWREDCWTRGVIAQRFHSLAHALGEGRERRSAGPTLLELLRLETGVTEREALGIGLAERMTGDPNHHGAELFEELREGFTAPDIVEPRSRTRRAISATSSPSRWGRRPRTVPRPTSGTRSMTTKT